MAKTVRMSDIAKQLGVSTVTVSKALSGQKGVSEELRRKIMELAAALGYQSPASIKEEDRRSYTIGVLVSEIYIEKYDTFYWELYQRLNRQSAAEGCFVMLEVLNSEDEQCLTEPNFIRESKIDGLIVLGSLKKQYLTMLKETLLPAVYLDFYDMGVNGESIISSGYYGACHLTRYLFDKGHRRIAFVGTLLATESITDRYMGYAKALLLNGQSVREDWIIPDRDMEMHCFERITLPADMPTAFVCNCDRTAARLIKSLGEEGLKVPEDISVVGYDDYLYPGLCDTGITTYAVDSDRMAREGVDLLLKKIKGEPYPEGLQVVEGHLIERDSVRRAQ